MIKTTVLLQSIPTIQLLIATKSQLITLLISGWMILFSIRTAIWLIERNRKG